jgi:hypothetical protein
MIGWMMIGFAIGVIFCKVVDNLQEKAQKKIQKVEADIIREGQIKELVKLKEELEKEK